MADNEIVPVTVGDLTQGVINGSGVFDQIMSTIDIRVIREYDLNRIKGTDYSKVYLGAMEAAMGQSVAFLLGKDKAANEAALILAQVALAEAQKDKVLAEIVLLELQAPKIEAEIRAIDAGIIKTQAEVSLIGKQELKIAADIKATDAGILKTEAEIVLIEKQAPKIDAEIRAIDQSIVKSAADIRAIDAGILKTQAEINLMVKQEPKIVAETSLIGSQEDKVDRETANLKYQHDFMYPHQADEVKHKAHLIALQEQTEQAKTRDLIQIEGGSSILIGGLMGGQVDKLERESDLIIVKRAAEAGQFLDTIYVPNTPEIHGKPVKGSIGKQKAVWDAQITGFDRDAEKNLAKIFSDSYSVQVSNSEASGKYGIEASEVRAVMDWARNKSSVPPPIPQP